MISLILVIKFVLGTLKFTNGEEVNSCHIYSNEIARISKWSELMLKSQDNERINQIFDKSGIKIKSKMEVIDKYYEIVAKPLQSGCNVLKRIAGAWGENGSGVYLDNYCGFQDGEKLLCMDGLYKSVQNQTCLVYSFGLGNDWDFELFMAELG